MTEINQTNKETNKQTNKQTNRQGVLVYLIFLFSIFLKIWFVFHQNIQLSTSKEAQNGGAYFSAVCGWKLIPISAPEPYECRERARLLFFYQPGTFPFPHTYAHHPLLHGHFQQANYGWKWIPINAPEPYEHRECCRLLVFYPRSSFLCPTHAHSNRSSMWISNRICSKAGQVDFSTAEKSTRPAFEQILLEIHMEERMLCVCVGQSKVPHSVLCAHTVLGH